MNPPFNLEQGLTDLLADEPAYVLDPDGAVRSGRRRRRRTQTAVAASLAVTAGAVGAAVFAVAGNAPVHRATVETFAAQPSAAAATSEGDDSVAYQVAREHTPAGWSISNSFTDGGGWWADVDAGQGANRLGLTVSTGHFQLTPCSDPEYVDGASCTATVLSPTATLIVRGYSHDNGGYSSAYAEIVHPDGSGVEASIDNATWPQLRPGAAFPSAAVKSRYAMGTIGTTTPIYSTDQLVDMAKALDAAQG